ncbi:uncharacterized protein F5891DRAFT_989688 [Suillus fuscotomentosus]|uniref:Uncharacterized protein n=1 Tax=Suillus fuscotomentosus TaxID=1912939 RepID=A0AAD4HBU3_9AGAM|nr:uncharacterized protein F5891DRAFT_989688 [Suillus fuscotomentosus]KAG1885332.1 hypothetical protein F5891DRAFT_989688 [Suillus fuscotomentosus]
MLHRGLCDCKQAFGNRKTQVVLQALSVGGLGQPFLNPRVTIALGLCIAGVVLTFGLCIVGVSSILDFALSVSAVGLPHVFSNLCLDFALSVLTVLAIPPYHRMPTTERAPGRRLSSSIADYPHVILERMTLTKRMDSPDTITSRYTIMIHFPPGMSTRGVFPWDTDSSSRFGDTTDFETFSFDQSLHNDEDTAESGTFSIVPHLLSLDDESHTPASNIPRLPSPDDDSNSHNSLEARLNDKGDNSCWSDAILASSYTHTSLLNFHTHYKKLRAPQLMNALVHAKAKELNADLPTGSKYTMKEVRKLVEEDPTLHPHALSCEEKSLYS